MRSVASTVFTARLLFRGSIAFTPLVAHPTAGHRSHDLVRSRYAAPT